MGAARPAIVQKGARNMSGFGGRSIRYPMTA